MFGRSLKDFESRSACTLFLQNKDLTQLSINIKILPTLLITMSLVSTNLYFEKRLSKNVNVTPLFLVVERGVIDDFSEINR